MESSSLFIPYPPPLKKGAYLYDVGGGLDLIKIQNWWRVRMEIADILNKLNKIFEELHSENIVVDRPFFATKDTVTSSVTFISEKDRIVCQVKNPVLSRKIKIFFDSIPKLCSDDYYPNFSQGNFYLGHIGDELTELSERLKDQDAIKKFSAELKQALSHQYVLNKVVEEKSVTADTMPNANHVYWVAGIILKEFFQEAARIDPVNNTQLLGCLLKHSKHISLDNTRQSAFKYLPIFENDFDHAVVFWEIPVAPNDVKMLLTELKFIGLLPLECVTSMLIVVKGTTIEYPMHQHKNWTLDNAITEVSKLIKQDPESLEMLNAYAFRGLAFLHKKEYVKAIHDLTHAMNAEWKEPHGDFALLRRLFLLSRLAEVYRLQKNYTKAIQLFDEVCNNITNITDIKGPKEDEEHKNKIHAYARAHRGEAYRQQRSFAKDDYDKAYADLQAAYKKDPTNLFTLSRFGMLFGDYVKYEQTIKVFNELFTLCPSLIDPKLVFNYPDLASCAVELSMMLWRCGNFFMQQGKKTEALQYFSAALVLNPDYRFARYYRGIANYQLGKLNNALKDFDQTNYSDSGLRMYRGKIYFLLGENEMAIKELSFILIANHTDPEALAYRAAARLQLVSKNKQYHDQQVAENVTLAQQDLEKINTQDLSILAFAKAQTAFLHALQHNDAKAEVQFNEALQLNPQDPFALKERGLLFCRQRKLIDAEKDLLAYLACVEIHETNDAQEMSLHLGKIYLQQKKFIEAEKKFREVIQTNSNNTYAQTELAYVLQLQKKDIEALEVIAEVLAKEPNNQAAHLCALRVLYKHESWVKALSHADKIETKDENKDMLIPDQAFVLCCKAYSEFFKLGSEHNIDDICKRAQHYLDEAEKIAVKQSHRARILVGKGYVLLQAKPDDSENQRLASQCFNKAIGYKQKATQHAFDILYQSVAHKELQKTAAIQGLHETYVALDIFDKAHMASAIPVRPAQFDTNSPILKFYSKPQLGAEVDTKKDLCDAKTILLRFS